MYFGYCHVCQQSGGAIPVKMFGLAGSLGGLLTYRVARQSVQSLLWTLAGMDVTTHAQDRDQAVGRVTEQCL
jgi:hypothetical protein